MRSVVENERAGLGDDGRRADVLDSADADRLDGDGGGGVTRQKDRAEDEDEDGEGALHLVPALVYPERGIWTIHTHPQNQP